MKIVLLSAVGIMLANISMAQHKFGFTPYLGISKIINQKVYLNNFKEKQNPHTQFAESFGFSFDYSFEMDALTISSGLGVTNIVGQQYETVNLYDIENGELVNTLRSEKERSNIYLTVPIMMRTSSEKMAFGLGFRAMYALSGSTENTIMDQYQTASPRLQLISNGGSDIADLDFGINLEISYSILSNVAIVVRSYFGLMDVSDGNELGPLHDMYQFENYGNQSELYNRQFTIGLSYWFN